MDHVAKVPWFRRFSDRIGRPAAPLATALFTLIGAACSAGGDGASDRVATTDQAVTTGPSTCNYSVATKVEHVGKKGFRAHVDVTNVSGTPSTGFTVQVNGGAATLRKVTHGTFQANQYGDVLSPDAKLARRPLEQGRTYDFGLKFSGPYTSLAANIVSNDGVTCDQTAPTVALTASGTLFTANGTLALAAQASDDVAVGKVVFTDDGATIASVYSAPYTVTIPVTNAINGRHVYAATAYDLSGNSATTSQTVLVAIGNKFFGTAVTNAADYTDLLTYFDQITPANAGKWGSVEATQGTFDWTDLDTAYNFAKANHLPFKFHNLIWGSQQPSWITSLSAADQLTAIDTWMAAVAARYPDLDMIDVVNEPLHTPPPYAAALGGAGTTGWDWVITAYEMAREHFPNAQLLVNDYFTLAVPSITQQYLQLIGLLQDRGLVDGIGEQAHFYEKSPDLTTLETNLDSLAATGLPIYISELDLNLANDAQQAVRMSQLFPIFWSNPSVVGVTEWGYLQGNTWEPNTYLIRSDGSLRPSLTWLECYLAGNASCPVPTYVPPPHTGEALGITLPAVDYDAASGLLAAGNVVAFASDGSWLAFDQVAFDTAWNSLTVTYANGGTTTVNLNVSLGGVTNPIVATVPLAPTGGWNEMTTVSVPWTPLGTSEDVYFEFQGGGANLQTILFEAPGAQVNLIPDGTFESGQVGAWFSYNDTTFGVTTASAHSGTYSALATGLSNGAIARDISGFVSAGNRYQATAWVSVANVASGSETVDWQTIQNCDGAASDSFPFLTGPTVANGQWVQVTGVVDLTGCTVIDKLDLFAGAASGDLYLDDVSLLALP